LIHKNERGFTLVELIIAIAITAIITTGVTMTIFQVFTGNARSSNHMIAVRQVQNAGYWVSHDAQMAQLVVTTGVSGFPLILTWTDWDGTEHQVTYDIVNGDELKRSEGATETIVAKYIDPDPANTSCKFIGGGAFSLPDSGDILTISGGAAADNGTITISAGSVTATPADGATVDGGTDPVDIDSSSGDVPWTTPPGTGTITLAATAVDTSGNWTTTVASATAAITADTDGDANVTAALAFRVTATVGSQEEMRVYEVNPRPN